MIRNHTFNKTGVERCASSPGVVFATKKSSILVLTPNSMSKFNKSKRLNSNNRKLYRKTNKNSTIVSPFHSPQKNVIKIFSFFYLT